MTDQSLNTPPNKVAANGFLNDFLRFDQKSKFCFFDFETEGLNLVYSRPWQAAFINVIGDDIIDQKDMYVYWKGLKVSAEAARITGYDADKVKRIGLKPEVAIEILEQQFEAADFIIGHNAIFFDHNIYKGWCRRLGRKPLNLRDKLMDTFLFAKSIKLNIPFRPDVDRYAFFAKLYNEIVKRLGCSLGVLAKDYGIVVDDSKLHDALYDLGINVQVWNKMKWNIPV